MKKLFVVMMALALISVIILPAGVAAAASPQEEVSGDFVLGIADLGILPVGSVYKGWEDQVIDYTGDIDGTQTGTCYFTYNLKSSALASVGVQTFTGTVLGKTGTLTLRVPSSGLCPDRSSGRNGEGRAYDRLGDRTVGQPAGHDALHRLEH